MDTSVFDKAINAHRKWKVRLEKIIDTGQSEYTPEHVREDSNCSLGKWLHQRIEPEHKTYSEYPSIVDLHARFHQEAADVLQLALAGRKVQARGKLALGSEFAKISSQLVLALGRWKQSLS